MKKIRQIIILGLLQWLIQYTIQAQEFYICTSTNDIRKVQLPNCTSQVKVRANSGFNDISFHPSGKLYGVTGFGTLHEIDTIAGTTRLITTFQSTTGQPFNSLTSDRQGIIYATGYHGEIHTFNPQSGLRNILGTTKVNGATVRAAGDMTFYKGDLYVASTRSLVKVNLNNPQNSSIYMNFNVSNEIFGIVSFVECGAVSTYATSGDNSGIVFKIDWDNRVLVRTCQVNVQIYGGASRYEFFASNVSPDTTRLVNYTCQKSQERELPPRTLRNQLGCDSVVLEKIVFAKSDTTRSTTLTCNPQLVRSDSVRLQNVFGCDSLVIVETKIGNDSIARFGAICRGDSFSFYNQWLRQTGIYTKSFQKTSGCDSIITLDLKVFDKQRVVLDSFVCQTNRVGSDSILLNNFVGCDSLVVHNRFLAPRLNDKTQVSWQICRGDTIRIGQNRFYTEGVFSVLLKNQYGCDSTVTLNLSLLRKDTTIRTTETCDPKKLKDSTRLLKNIYGCDSLIIFKTKLIENPYTISNLPQRVEMTIGDSVQLSPQLNFTPISVQWTPSIAVTCSTCLSVFTNIRQSTKIHFFAKDNRNCTVEQEVLAFVNQNRKVFIPNVFSPDGDTVNDVFTIYGDANLVSILSLQIYDRWGELVFSGDNLKPNTEGWDGQFRNSLQQTGVFVYWVKLRFKNGDEIVYKGDVTLLR